MTTEIQASDPTEECRPTGEVFPLEAKLIQEAAAKYFESEVATWQEGLPAGHEPVTKVDGEDTRAKNIRLSIGEKATEYGVRIAQETGEHQKEIITTLTVAGLLLAIKGIHAWRSHD